MKKKLKTLSSNIDTSRKKYKLIKGHKFNLKHAFGKANGVYDCQYCGSRISLFYESQDCVFTTKNLPNLSTLKLNEIPSCADICIEEIIT